jgi:U3 small nucleolar RNA-associated protein 13
VLTPIREQDFLNYCALKNYRKAIELALSLEQPGRLLNLFKDIRSGLDAGSSEIGSSITGHPAVDEVIGTLAASDLAKLLRYVRDWNTNIKTTEVAQGVLFAILKLRSAEDVISAFDKETEELPQNEPLLASDEGVRSGSALKELLDALVPYTERHLARMEKLVQDSYVVDYILGEMDGGMMDAEFGSENDEMMDIDYGVRDRRDDVVATS